MNFEISEKWFIETAPVNAGTAQKNIGAGENGVISVRYKEIGTAGNAYSIEFVSQDGINKDMSVALAGTKITVTLGKDAADGISVTANTAKLISEAIDTLPDFVSTYSGTGETPISQTIEEVALNGGKFGTFCPVPYTMVKDDTYFYVNIAPNSTHDANWRRFTLATY